MTILDSSNELLYDKSREAELMDILGIQSMDEVTIIPWRHPATPPRDGSYVFLKYYDPYFHEVSFEYFAYENGVYSYPLGDGNWLDLSPALILGWTYPISYCK